MRPADLQEFLAMLEQAGELSRVRCPVDADLEVAAIINAVCKQPGGGPALLFENVNGSPFPLTANLFGSMPRLAMALGGWEADAMAAKLRNDLAGSGAENAAVALQMLVSAAGNQAIQVGEAACFEREITSRGLEILPALRCWPGDGGRYLTLAQVITRHPETGVENCGMYRVQLAGPDQALLRCHPGSGGAEHVAAWLALGEAMPVAIALGGPPLLTWLAGMPLPEGVSETTLAGYLCGHPLSMGCCPATRLSVPAAAEIVIEGFIRPGEERMEGPFGNHTGRYAPAVPAPLIRVERVSMRHGAVYPCTLVGPPPMENHHLAARTTALLLTLLQFDNPWVVDLSMPRESIYHGAAMIAVAGDCGLSLAEISRALWSSVLLKKARLLVLLDSDVLLSDLHQVYWHVINAGVWPPANRLEGQKVVLDARTPPGAARVAMADHTASLVAERWQEYGLPALSGDKPDQPSE